MSASTRARTLATTAVAVGAFALTGCGADSGEQADPAPSSTVTESPSPTEPTPTEQTTKAPEPERTEDEGTTVDLKIAGDQITPTGDRIELSRGETIRLNITSDRAGELHVHSNPEQTLDFAAGQTTLNLEIDNPGLIDVEDHESGIVIIQLEVR